LETILNTVNNIIWSNALILLCLGAGVYFSIVTRFLQIRYVREMLRLLFNGAASAKGVSSFQAFSLAIAGRVGTGNIAGVATAIAMGGPGAIFWMWIIAFLGSASAFIEATLGQIYKQVKDGQYRGGPAFYIEKGLGMKWYAVIFAVTTVCSAAIFLPGVQSNSIATGMHNAFSIPAPVSGVLVAGLLGLIIFGGVRRIGRVAELIVPFMAAAYILMAVIIIAINIHQVPAVLTMIIRSAFGFDPAFAGLFGMAVSWGIKRGIYSNEAGQGTAPHAAAAAEVSHPVKQGLVQAFSVYIDTLFVCTATAFMILFTGQYNVENPKGGFMLENIPGVIKGPHYTQLAISQHFPSLGAPFVSVALFFFAFTTLMAYYYIAETNLSYLNRERMQTWKLWILRGVMMSSVFYGAVKTADAAWVLGDIGVGLMAWLNIIAILLLRKPAFKAFKNYCEQRKQGVEPQFNAAECGIKNADEW
jgi:AGCS family alanine or glycine:cation symporter